MIVALLIVKWIQVGQVCNLPYGDTAKKRAAAAAQLRFDEQRQNAADTIERDARAALALV